MDYSSTVVQNKNSFTVPCDVGLAVVAVQSGNEKHIRWQVPEIEHVFHYIKQWKLASLLCVNLHLVCILTRLACHSCPAKPFDLELPDLTLGCSIGLVCILTPFVCPLCTAKPLDLELPNLTHR